MNSIFDINIVHADQLSKIYVDYIYFSVFLSDSP